MPAAGPAPCAVDSSVEVDSVTARTITVAGGGDEALRLGALEWSGSGPLLLLMHATSFCADVWGPAWSSARAAGLATTGATTWGRLVDDLFSEHVEPKLIQPVFITDYPVELSPLAKRSSARRRRAATASSPPASTGSSSNIHRSSGRAKRIRAPFSGGS